MNHDDMEKIKTLLKSLLTPFPENLIGKLPKPTKQQTEELKRDISKGVRCLVCGGWHHPKVVHLDYVGHAAITFKLLEVDPFWSWEPFAVDQDGLPKFDGAGGLWIKLTILGLTRNGYGHADGKTGGDAIKEAIGDAIRNAAMRFGAALDLWHKGELHKDEELDNSEKEKEKTALKNYEVQLITMEQIQIIGDLMHDNKFTEDDKKLFIEFISSGAISELEDLPAALFSKARAKLEARLARVKNEGGAQ